MRIRSFGFLCLVAGLVTAPVAFGQTYADITSATAGNPGSASGTLGVDSFVYAGDVSGFQLSGSGGTNPWIPTSTYTSAAVPNAPTDDAIIEVSAGGTNTLTFTTPVTGLIFDVFSLGGGRTDTTYDFGSSSFTVLSCGPNAYFGGGCFAQGVGSTGTTLSGVEANGMIEFSGTLSSLSFTVTDPETFSGFDFGAVTPASTPEPSSLMLLGSGLLAGAGMLRRRLVRK